ncbi:MAG: DUF4276 family protein [Candidatus Glassbacteria bacterium]|nr:DUF4276 family protein [Candidatus Glassbacteria bacterium]
MNLREHGKATRIIVLCEGETEVIAVREFIKRKWEENGLRSVGLIPIDLRGQLGNLHDKAERFCRDEKNIAVFTLVDLHEFKGVDLRGFGPLTEKIGAAKKWLKNDFETRVLEKFHPHLAVHETEAWILADGEALANRLRNRGIRPRRNAEKIDDQNPPKKILDELFKKYRKHEYRVLIDGAPLFKKMDFTRVYGSCPNFREFYEDLKSAAQAVR